MRYFAFFLVCILTAATHSVWTSHISGAQSYSWLPIGQHEPKIFLLLQQVLLESTGIKPS